MDTNETSVSSMKRTIEPESPRDEPIAVVEIQVSERLTDYQVAMRLANEEADRRLGPNMLLSWFDRDRNFESPQHASECHLDCATPGYVDYGLNHGATLKIDIEDGRFVFFYLAVDS